MSEKDTWIKLGDTLPSILIGLAEKIEKQNLGECSLMHPEDYPKEIQRCLRVVWVNEEPCRYMPRPIVEGPGWEVWDHKLDIRVPIEKLATMTFEEITETISN